MRGLGRIGREKLLCFQNFGRSNILRWETALRTLLLGIVSSADFSPFAELLDTLVFKIYGNSLTRNYGKGILS